MCDIFKIQRGNRSNRWSNRIQNSAGGLTEGCAFRSRRAFCPVFGGVSGRRDSRHPQQVVSSRHEVTPGLRPLQSPIPAPAESAHGFHPAKDFLHPFADLQTNLITPLCRGASVQSGHLHFVFARHMRRDLPCPAALHKALLVIALVRSNRLEVYTFMQLLVGVGLLQRHDRLAFRNRVVQGEGGTQAVPVLHQGVRAETQPGLLPAGFPIQHALGIGRALVRVVAPLFPAKVDRGVAGVFVFGGLYFLRIRPVFADKAFQAGPRFDERAVGGEVVVTGPAGLPAQVIDFHEEESGHIGREHALIVLGKDAVVETAFVELPVQKPKPEQIVAELLAKEPFAAHAVKGAQHARLEQLLRRNAVAPGVGVKFVKQRGEFFQDGVHLAFDGAQRMLRRHTLVEVDDRQKVRLSLRFSAHALSDITPNETFQRKIVFQQIVSNDRAAGMISATVHLPLRASRYRPQRRQRHNQ